MGLGFGPGLGLGFGLGFGLGLGLGLSFGLGFGRLRRCSASRRLDYVILYDCQKMESGKTIAVVYQKKKKQADHQQNRQDYDCNF